MTETIEPLRDSRPASLFIFPDRIVWASRGFRGEATSRPTCALLIRVYKELAITLEDEHVFRSRALLIGPNVIRALDADEVGFYSLNLDPSHAACSYLRRQILAGQEVVMSGRSSMTPPSAAVTWAVENGGTCADSERISDQVVARMFPGAVTAKPPDARVLRVAFWPQGKPAGTRRHQLCEICHLSDGRPEELDAPQGCVGSNQRLITP